MTEGSGFDRLNKKLDEKVSRRDFLKGIGIGAAGIFLSGCGPDSVKGGPESFESLQASNYSHREYGDLGEKGVVKLSDALNEAMKEHYKTDKEWAFDNNIDMNYVDAQVKVMVISLDGSGKVTGVYLANDWKGFYNEVDDGDPSTGVNQEIDTHELFSGKGIVAVAKENVMRFGRLLDAAEQSVKMDPNIPVKFDFWSQKNDKRVEIVGSEVFAALRNSTKLDEAVGYSPFPDVGNK
jgi:hypothetical protein